MMKIIDKLFNIHKKENQPDECKNEKVDLNTLDERDFWNIGDDGSGIYVGDVFKYYSKKGYGDGNGIDIPVLLNSVIVYQENNNIIKKYIFDEPIKVRITKLYKTIPSSKERKAYYSLSLKITHNNFKEEIMFAELAGKKVTLSLSTDNENELLICSRQRIITKIELA